MQKYMQIAKNLSTINNKKSSDNHAENSRLSKSLIQASASSVTNNRHTKGFMTATECLKNDRKRPSAQTDSAAGEPLTKKIQTNIVAMEVKNDVRILTGDVGQTLNFKTNLSSNAFHEVYGMVFSIRCKDRQKSLLLRNANGRGPVLKGVFHEIDAKMVDVKPGDLVRVVGKLRNKSWLQIFKITLLSEQHNQQLVQRLFSLSNFALTQTNRENH